MLFSYKDTYKKTFGTTSYYTETMQGEIITVDYYNIYSGSFTNEYELVGKPYKSMNFGLIAGAGVQKKILISQLYRLCSITSWDLQM